VIAHLTGTLRDKQLQRITVDVGGVGYDVHVPLSTMFGLGDPGAPVSLRIHTHVTDESIRLFGFATALEQQLFEWLISISRIGPKVALAVLSGIDSADLVKAVRGNDIGRLTSIPGVGRKNAERMVIELKDRVNKLASSATDLAPVPGDDVRDDLLSALTNLGYQRAAAEKAVERAFLSVTTREFEPLLREVLKALVR
jgi:Holliday junction DNA helicase RuvA